MEAQSGYQANICLSTNEQSALLRTTPTQLFEEEVKQVPISNLQAHLLVSLVREHALEITKRERQAPTQHKNFDLQFAPLQNMLAQW